MDKNKLWKWLLLGFLLLWSIVLIMPPKDKIKLGLDLAGGSEFMVQVDRDDTAEKMVAANDELTDVKQVKSSDLDKQITDVRDTAVEMIRNRVDLLGTAEPEIYPEGDDRIVVRLPGAGPEVSEAARDQITKEGVLTFKLVHSANKSTVTDLLANQPAPEGFKKGGDGYYIRDKQALADKDLDRDYFDNLKTFGGYVGKGELMLEKDKLPNSNTVIYRPWFVEIRPQMGGDDIVNAGVGTDPNTGGYEVNLEFGKEGTKTFGEVTGQNVGRQLAIILDGTLYSAPVLNGAIEGGSARITGSFGAEEARQLANVLRAGKMKGRLNVINEHTVAPTLGKDSVSSGIQAIIWGGVAVLVFMGCYYLVPGMIANLSLVFVLLLLPVGMMLSSGFLGVISGSLEGSSVSLPTLTLYGIAGIVLTVGMAVDANVLTFERMREEWKVGKSISGSINAGYNKAFSTILDANVTTLLTAIILFWQGSGPIRGFAVTLSAGILVSMFIVLVITRLFFNTLADGGMLKSIKMMSMPFLRDANFNFIGGRKIAAILSLVLIAGSWAWFVKKGDANYGVDFTGGTTVKCTFSQAQTGDTVRKVLADIGVDAQPTMSKDGKKLDLRMKDNDKVAEVEVAVKTLGLEDGKVSIEQVGPQIGNELKKKGMWAIIWSLVGIIIYISIRFEFAFAMGAIVALAHDVLITVGIYCLLGRELSMPIIAALLTIVGYSVNDTIVVFDRIREDLKLVKGKSYKEIANLSINQTLSRTLLTSVTTLLTVVMLLVMGGGAVNDFALALFIGILVGTYSSVFVATPVVLLWHKEDEKPEEIVAAQ